MSELITSTRKKVVAFYLPQFHSIPENDKWWGKGFTEWTNTRKATPLFAGHYQPKIPKDENYYDLSDARVLEEQSIIAQNYGVYGFCYYHYWFKNGKKLLEKPVEQMLHNPRVNIPFMLCWANENWTRNWDGGCFEVIARQEYGTRKDWQSHIDYLLPFFKDDRYITFQGKPILIIYKPEQIILFDEMVALWRKTIMKAGFPGLIVLRQYPGTIMRQLDGAVKFQPMYSLNTGNDGSYHKQSLQKEIKSIVKKSIILAGKEQYLQQKMVDVLTANKKSVKPLRIYDYDECWQAILNDQFFNDRLCNGAFTAWDNTARNKRGVIFLGSTPEKFERYMTELFRKSSAMDLVFINAWNEWGEGAYLEADEKYGYAYLEALKNAIDHAGS